MKEAMKTIMARNKKLIWVSSALALSALFLGFTGRSPQAAQTTQPPPVAHNPIVNQAIHFDISPPFRDLAKIANNNYSFREADTVRRPKEQLLRQIAARQLPPIANTGVQKTILPPVGALLGLNLLGVGVGFPNYNNQVAPPDTTLSVGETQVVQWVNLQYAVFSKSTGAVLLGATEGNALWSGFGGGCETQNPGDIITLWDKRAHRWLMAQNAFDVEPYLTCVAISTTSDATGTYYRYSFPQPNGFPDYPKWGIWTDGYYQHNNVFGGPNGFGSEPCAYNRDKMLIGDATAQQICFFNSTSTFDDSLLPSDIDSTVLPPKGEPEIYLGSIDNTNPSSVIYEYLFHVNFANPTLSTLTGFGGTMPITVNSFNLGCSGFSDCVQQKGVSDVLEALGDRLMYRLAYRNFGNYQDWVVEHDVTSPGNTVAPAWYEFRAKETSFKMLPYQDSTFAPDNSYRWMGSLAMDKMGDIFFGYSISSSSLYPSINYTGRLATDPLNTLETEATLVSGTGAQTGTSDRWGDYSTVQIDNADQCTFWYTTEFYMSTAQFDWSTQLASFKFPNCK